MLRSEIEATLPGSSSPSSIPMFTAMTTSAPRARATGTGSGSTTPPSTSVRPSRTTGRNSPGMALEEFLATHVKAPSIERLGIPCIAVATDLKTGEEVIFDRGPIGPAVHASSAIPGLFRPVVLDGRTLVDGGVVDPLPVPVARARGAEVVIAVNIGMELGEEEPGNVASISLRSIVLLGRELARLKGRGADVLISPKVGDTSSLDFSRKKELMAAGVAAAREAMPAIREAIARASSRSEPVSSHNQ